MYPKTNFFNNTTGNSPFGQTSFQKPVQGNFGQSSTFGQQNNSFFGNTQTQQGGFNSSVTNSFGTSPQPQQNFAAFPQAQPNSSLFATTQQNGNQSLIFGQAPTSAFGAPTKSSGFGFNQNQPSTSIFGQTNTTANTGFGTFANTSNNVFGNNTSSFGQQNITNSNVNNGSGIAKYQPLIGTDTIVKSGQQNNVNTKLHCITAMKEYESKSLEELRIEDYTSNRKGSANNIFGTQSTSTGGIFGSNTSQTTGLFGNQNEKSLFGISNNISGSSFAANNNTNTAFGQTNQQSAGFFSKPFSTPTSTNNNFVGFGNTENTVSSFGGKVYNQPNTTGLFGQSITPSVSSFNQPNTFAGFGTTNTQPPMFGNNSNDKSFGVGSTTSSTGFTNFGAINTTNTTSGNLFGKTTTGFANNTGFAAPVSNSGGFGIPNFGTASNSNSIFNSTLPKPANTSFTGFMPQGSSAPIGGNLNFNTGNQNLFGNSKSGTMFGSNVQPSNSLFGTNSNFGNLGTLGGFSNNPVNLNSNPGSAIISQHTDVPIHQQILSITTSPYGENQIFKDIKLSKTLDSTDAIRSTNPAAQKAILECGLGFKVLKNPGSSLKVKPIGSSLTKKALFDGLEEYDSSLEESFSFKKNAKRLILKSRLDPEKSEISQNVSSPIFAKENSTNNKNQSEINADELENGLRRESWLSPIPLEKFQEESFHLNSTFDSTFKELVTAGNKKSTTQNLSVEELKQLERNQGDGKEISLENVPSHEVKVNCAGIILNRVGYYTAPPLSELSTYLTQEGKCIVPNFTIGREGYGNVYFNNSIDITGINFDKIVHFRHKEVIIYPGEQNKPPIGHGLNREAQVTLDQVWPHDKTLHEPIKNLDRLEELDYEGKLRRVCDKYDIRFIEYRPETGSWVFKVKHFSKYGLSDSDEETLTSFKPKEVKMSVQPVFPVKKITSKLLSNEDNSTIKDSNFFFKQNEVIEKNEQSCTSQASAMVKDLGADTHKLQLMKSSFFVYEDSDTLKIPTDDLIYFDNYDQIVPGMIGSQSINSMMSLSKDTQSGTEIVSNNNSKGRNNGLLQENLTNFGLASCVNNTYIAILIKPIVSLRNIFEEELRETNIIESAQTNCISDLKILNFRRFKVSFGPNYSLIIPSYSYQNKKENNKHFQFDKVSNKSSILKYFILKSDFNMFGNSFVPHLELQLKNSMRIEKKNNNCPFFELGGGVSIISEHLSVAQQRSNDHRIKNDISVLSFCEALWGYKEEMESQSSHHFLTIYRKNVLSKWLEHILIENKEYQEKGRHSGNEFFHYLYCQKISEACIMLMENREPYLALMLSQISSGPTTKQLIAHQLQEWQKVKTDEYIHLEKLELLMLISGTQLMSCFNGPINVLQNLHWLKVFAIQLWYLCSATSSVTDVVNSFDNLLKIGKDYFLPPYPDYMENVEQLMAKPIYDVKYHILQIFSKRSYSIETIINPLTHTNNILDFRLSWIIFNVLKAIGYNHCSILAKIKLYMDVANQLENQGLWHWSIFIILHIDVMDKRELSVQQILYRNVSIKKNCDIDDKEKFVINTLGIPLRWIYWAKSVKAGAFNQHFKQARYLIKSKKIWEAHNIVVSLIAPAAVVNDKLEFLNSLVNHLEELKVKNVYNNTTWTNQGQILIDFLEINKKFTILRESNESNIEEMWENLKPSLIDLCSRINMFACPTAIHRLCQSEMAQRLACFSRGFFLTSNNKNPCFLIKIALEKLPLPQEYAQQELRVLLDALINEVFK